MKTLTKYILIFSLLVPLNAFGKSQRYYLLYDFSKLSQKEFLKVHKKYISFLIKNEKFIKYPTFKKNRFSFFKNIENKIEKFPFSFINEAHAANNSRTCLFGGWISKKGRDGGCQEPWNVRGYSKALNTDPYGPKCGSKNLFRCKGSVFGPGPTKKQIAMLGDGIYKNASGKGENYNPKAGICINTGGSYSGLTKKCNQLSIKLDRLRGKPWAQTMAEKGELKPFIKDFRAVQEHIASFCAKKDYKDNTCGDLAGAIERVVKVKDFRVAVEDVVNIKKFIDEGIDTSNIACLESQKEKAQKSVNNYYESFNPYKTGEKEFAKEDSMQIDPVSDKKIDEFKNNKVIGPLYNSISDKKIAQFKGMKSKVTFKNKSHDKIKEFFDKNEGRRKQMARFKKDPSITSISLTYNNDDGTLYVRTNNKEGTKPRTYLFEDDLKREEGKTRKISRPIRSNKIGSGSVKNLTHSMQINIRKVGSLDSRPGSVKEEPKAKQVGSLESGLRPVKEGIKPRAIMPTVKLRIRSVEVELKTEKPALKSSRDTDEDKGNFKKRVRVIKDSKE